MESVPDPAPEGVLVRLVGVVACVIAVAFLLLAGFLVDRQIQLHRKVETGALLFLGGLVTLTIFFGSVGWRYTFNRPNRYGSALGPFAWRLVAAVLMAVAFGVAAIAARSGAGLESLAPIVGVAVFASWCWRRASQAQARGKADAAL